MHACHLDPHTIANSRDFDTFTTDAASISRVAANFEFDELESHDHVRVLLCDVFSVICPSRAPGYWK